MGFHYAMYVILGLVFWVLETIVRMLKLNGMAKALGSTVIGINDNRPKEVAPKDSVVKSEVEHLGKMVSFWWNKTGPVQILHSFYQVRVPLVVEGLAAAGRIPKANISKPDSLKDIRILDAGCGGGILAEDLARLGAYVVGVDPGKEMIDLAVAHMESDSAELKSHIEYHAVTVEEHAKQFAGTYDAIVCSEVLEHVDEKESILEACVKCLKPGGSLFITTENQTLLAWFAFVITAEYIGKFIPKGTHCYEKFISPEDVSKILQKYNCKTYGVRGTFYDCLNNRWEFIANNQCNYGLHAIKN